jgi:hypothetical protein
LELLCKYRKKPLHLKTWQQLNQALTSAEILTSGDTEIEQKPALSSAKQEILDSQIAAASRYSGSWNETTESGEEKLNWWIQRTEQGTRSRADKKMAQEALAQNKTLISGKKCNNAQQNTGTEGRKRVRRNVVPCSGKGRIAQHQTDTISFRSREQEFLAKC